MIEAALIFPILVILAAGLYDVYRATEAYDIVSDVAQEAARYAGRVRDLEPGTFCTNCVATVPPAPAEPSAPSTATPGQQNVHNRIQSLLAARSGEVNISDLEIVTQLQDDSGTNVHATELGGSNPTRSGVILIRVRGNYEGLFSQLIFGSTYSINVLVASQYLY